MRLANSHTCLSWSIYKRGYDISLLDSRRPILFLTFPVSSVRYINCKVFLASPCIRKKSGICIGCTTSRRSLPKSNPRCLTQEVHPSTTPFPLPTNLFSNDLHGLNGSPRKVPSTRKEASDSSSLLFPFLRNTLTPSPMSTSTTVSSLEAATAQAVSAKLIFSALFFVLSNTTRSGTVAAGLRNPIMPRLSTMAFIPFAASSDAASDAR
mmetsp:Transcript_25199/g.37094  ORF Transcript_25199/g.37094 Transcript_25199/m.37094 type:complete len:209 (-) Transcript_25199:408-1034(-)